MDIVLIVVLIILLVGVVISVKIVNTGYVFVVERLGQYHRTLQPGWHFVVPFIDYVRARVSTKQQILDVDKQEVITKDNVKISIDNVIFFKIMSARDATYNIEDYQAGLFYSTANNMRNIVGNMALDEVLSGRDRINAELLKVLDEITEAYGVKILSAEIRAIDTPIEIQVAMEKQMKAERDKRAAILDAEGKRASSIAIAEGEKQAKILQAEGEKEANIRRAEGLKQSQMLEAEGKARAIEVIADAEAIATIKVTQAILNAGTNSTVIALKQVEALQEMAKNPANKIIMGNEALSSLGSISAVSAMLGKE